MSDGEGRARRPPGCDERELLRRARRGEPDAAEELARRHFAAAWRAARAITGRADLADEAVQNAYERAFRNIGRADPRRPFSRWLHRIVVNCALDAVRHAARAETPLAPDQATAADPIERALDERELLDALAGLDPDRRTVVVARLLLGYSPPEVADMLGIAEGTVNSRLSRALAELRTILAGICD